MKVEVDQGKCIGCGTCVSMCAECFEMGDNHKAHPKNEKCNCGCEVNDVVSACPSGAISVEGEEKPAEEKAK